MHESLKRTRALTGIPAEMVGRRMGCEPGNDAFHGNDGNWGTRRVDFCYACESPI